ncbi:MAG: peptide chain release factor N(5)-glutamine methyltransferase [Acidobacteriota bacterium]
MRGDPSLGAAFARVADALRWGEEQLRKGRIPGARLQATLLLGHAMKLSRAQVLACLAEPVLLGPAHDYRGLVARRAAHEPLQYLRGRAAFLDFEVRVNPGVFIPRPETELVVEAALRVWPSTGSLTAGPGWAVDVGTGSGAIALALAQARPGTRVCGLDRSREALDTARANAERLQVLNRLLLIRGDLLAPLGTNGGRAPDRIREAVGLVVSNPPYAPADADVQPEVRQHEPREAWAAGPTGMEVYARLIPQAAELLLPGRPLVLELGWGQDGPLTELLAADGRWQQPQIEPDFQEIPRVLTVIRA